MFIPGGGEVGILKAGAAGSSVGGAGLSAAGLLSAVVSFGGVSPGNRVQVHKRKTNTVSLGKTTYPLKKKG